MSATTGLRTQQHRHAAPRRVLVADPLYSLDAARAALEPHGVVVERADGPLGGEDVLALLTGSDHPLSVAEVERMPDLRLIATASVGFDHVPLELAADRGIWVCNVPGFSTREVADSTLALILALTRGTVFLDRSTLAGSWDSRAAGPLLRLDGLRLGLIGLGRIGRAVARRAAPFGFEVWAHDPALGDERIARAGVRPAGFEELLEGCDVVSLHAPLERGTRHLIGAPELARMREGAMLVNTSRGALVDVPALLDALDAGPLRSAALDVLPVEPPTSADPVPRHERLVVLPHAAWYSEPAVAEAYSTPIEVASALLAGAAAPEEVVVVRGDGRLGAHEHVNRKGTPR